MYKINRQYYSRVVDKANNLGLINVFYFQIKPVIQDEFKMSNVPEAFQKLQKCGSRGKIVIDMNRQHK